MNAFTGSSQVIVMSVASVLLSIMIALIPFIASRIVRGDIGSTLMTVSQRSSDGGSNGIGIGFCRRGGLGRRKNGLPQKDRRRRRPEGPVVSARIPVLAVKAPLLGKDRTPAMEAPRLASPGHQRLLPPRQAVAELAQLTLRIVKIPPLAETLPPLQVMPRPRQEQDRLLR